MYIKLATENKNRQESKEQGQGKKNYSASGKHFAAGLAAGLSMGQGIPVAYAASKGLLPTGDLSITDVPKEVQKQHVNLANAMLKTRGYTKTPDPIGLEDVYPMYSFSSPDQKRHILLDYAANSNMAKYGPHMEPFGEDFSRRFVRVGKGKFGTKGVLSHELGHALQSKGILTAYGITTPATIASIPILAAVGAYRSKDPEKQKKLDRYAKYGVGAATLGGLFTAGVEANASYKGYKMLRNSGILKADSPLKEKLEPFVGLPTYLALAAAPAAAYYGSRHLPGKINRLYERLKARRVAATSSPASQDQ